MYYCTIAIDNVQMLSIVNTINKMRIYLVLLNLALIIKKMIYYLKK